MRFPLKRIQSYGGLSVYRAQIQAGDALPYTVPAEGVQTVTFPYNSTVRMFRDAFTTHVDYGHLQQMAPNAGEKVLTGALTDGEFICIEYPEKTVTGSVVELTTGQTLDLEAGDFLFIVAGTFENRIDNQLLVKTSAGTFTGTAASDCVLVKFNVA